MNKSHATVERQTYRLQGGPVVTTDAASPAMRPREVAQGKSTYRRVLATRQGGPDVLELVEEPVPEPALGEARLRVLAAGVGFPDILMREGTYPGGPAWPFTPGCDVVGEVEAVGPGVTGVRPGDRVAALTYYGKVFGGYAEVVCLPADYLIPVPDGVDPVAAVCLVLNYTTAFQMLKRTARVVAGERLLVHGAAGGVGTAALELGRLYGLEMYGTASARDADVVRRLGATPIDYINDNFVKQLRTIGGVDVVLDGIGGSVSTRSYRVLRRGGRLVLFGHRSTLVEGRRSARKLVEFYASGAATLLANVLPDGRRVLTYQIAKLRDLHPEWFRADLGVLMTLLAEGHMAPLVADVVSLEDARRAHEILGRGSIAGKLVIVPRSAAV
jgi:NADPH2:quinone reductase